uniref:Uncharacterized protein n=1 Tax=Picea glauca TaxID=3330 RepID=A0A101M4X1_PICGL|nr:hypothetical protein ABT39_MTgene741 [Picea glauca]
MASETTAFASAFIAGTTFAAGGSIYGFGTRSTYGLMPFASGAGSTQSQAATEGSASSSVALATFSPVSGVGSSAASPAGGE